MADRLEAFKSIRFQPHGLYLPDDRAQQLELKKRLDELGDIDKEDDRNAAYFRLQRETERWAKQGLPGHWTGQQAVARSEARFRIVAWGRRGGKLLNIAHKLYTDDGYVSVGEVVVGDEVYGPDGLPHRVTYVTDTVFPDRTYHVHFSDGSVIHADAEHLWTVETKETRRSGNVEKNGKYTKVRPYHPPVTLTTEQLIERMHITAKTESNYSIPVCQPVQYPERNLPIDPYLLGVWLGDGTSASGIYTKPDDEIAEELRRRGETVSRVKVSEGKCPAWKVDGLMQKLRTQGLLFNKHIPLLYLRSSIQQRLDLVRGLMDTDGSSDLRGKCEFSTKFQHLAEQMQELLESLGQIVSICRGEAWLNGKRYDDRFRIAWSPTIEVFLLPRKLERQRISLRKIKGDRLRRFIVNIVPAESAPMRCIQIDSPDHLYLTEHYIATHNTIYAASEAVAIAMARPRSTCWLAAPTAKLSSRAFDYAVQYVNDLGLDARIRDQVQEKRILLPNGSIIEGISTENVLSIAGAAVDFAVIDEAAQITPEAWYRGVLPPLADRNGGALLISSFEGEGDFFSDKVIEVQKEEARAKELGFEFKPEWELFQAASYDVNFFAFPQGIKTKAIVDARRETPIEDFLEQYGGIVAGARNRVYPEFINRIHVGNYPFNPEHPVRLAIDPSSGANPYAIAVIQDYGDYIVIVDELYQRSTKVEDYDPIIQRKPWAPNIQDAIVDSAWPHDIIRLNEMGYRAYPVRKPMIEESIGVVKSMLRNSHLYDQMYRERINYFLVQSGYEPNSDNLLPLDVQKEIYEKVQASLAEQELTPEDVENLKMCSRLFVNRTCVNTIREFHAYRFRKRRNLNINFQETPQDYENHLLDAVRYLIWTHFRYNESDHPKLRSYMAYKGPRELPDGVTELPPPTPAQQQGRMWLEHHRAMHNRSSGTRSYMRKAS